MIARLFEGVPRRGVALLSVLLVVLLAAPWMANDYLLTVLIIIANRALRLSRLFESLGI